MQLADVSTEEEKVNIANDLKKKLDAINTAAAEYQNKKGCQQQGKNRMGAAAEIRKAGACFRSRIAGARAAV